ncbi:virion structural protein [Staphylococcus phage S25-4]|uniref:SGNH hydrolase-type esterase domain-containing protein n=1 Tax=Staphylococcus phage S25-4 TaxID=1041527 RepID=V5XV50_BPS24|nr:virion structural protein [Staphylococcus phage S25-4]BAO09405.1 hypothetical protein [Staphylococcus phage S25-4]
MSKKLKIYNKNNELLKESPYIEGSMGEITIDNLTPDTEYKEGDFKVCWDINGKESIHVNVPGFSTLKNSTEKILIVSYNVESPTTITAQNIEGLENSIDDYFYSNLYYDVLDIVKNSTGEKIIDLKSEIRDKRISPLENKVGLFIGDSITEINGRTRNNYHGFIADRTGLEVHNMGISGTGYQDRKNVAYGITEQPDFICIMLGTNDYGVVGGNNRELGNSKEHRYGTVAGSIYYTYLQLSREFPTTPIVVLTPTPRIESNPYKENKNSKGYTLGELVQVIKDIAKLFSFPVLDLYNNSNLRVWDSNVNNVFFSSDNSPADGLHPNTTGHEWLSNLIQPFLELKAVLGSRIEKPIVNHEIQDLGNNVFTKVIRPTGIFHKEDQSFIINIDKSDLDLSENKVLKVVYNNHQINDPNGILENSPYWYTLPNYEDGNEYNKNSIVSEFKKGLEITDIVDDGRVEYLRDYMTFYFTENSSTVKGSDINIEDDSSSVGEEINPTPTEPVITPLTPVDNGDGTLTVTLTPIKISWKQDQSFMININETQLDLSGKKVQHIDVSGTKLINPSETASNYFYWFSVPTSEEGTEFNRTEEINNFVTELESSSTEYDGRIVYKPIPVSITYK